jgi:hypothetical protein
MSQISLVRQLVMAQQMLLPQTFFWFTVIIKQMLIIQISLVKVLVLVQQLLIQISLVRGYEMHKCYSTLG